MYQSGLINTIHRHLKVPRVTSGHSVNLPEAADKLVQGTDLLLENIMQLAH